MPGQRPVIPRFGTTSRSYPSVILPVMMLSPRVTDVLARAAKTGAQTFAAAVVAGAAGVVDFATAKALVLSAGAAAISAAWNTIRAPKQRPVLVTDPDA